MEERRWLGSVPEQADRWAGGQRVVALNALLPPCLTCCLSMPCRAAQTNVGRQLKEMLQIPDQSKIGFMAHSDAKRDDRRAKERYTV